MTETPTDLGLTPSQTVGPFLAIALTWEDGPELVAVGTPGAVLIEGVLTDGAGLPVPDGLLEIWQADPDGRFDHPDDPRGARVFPGFRGFGRCPTDADGRFWFRTLVPGAVPGERGRSQAPHVDVSVFARGLLDRVVTRMYFPAGDGLSQDDPVLETLSPEERALLTAVAGPKGTLRFDIRLQGDGETPFFAL